jgi:hypothetical protein
VHFDRELISAEEFAQKGDLAEAFIYRIWADMLNKTLQDLEKVN